MLGTKGGLSIYGAATGLITAGYLFAVWNKYPFSDVFDSFVMSAALGAFFVRLGNFVNSEIVGRITDMPWAVRFVRYVDRGAYPRHPVQPYETLLALSVFVILLLADHRLGEERPRWLLTGLFFGLYFGGRIAIEPFKEYLVLDSGSSITMGQILSIPFAFIGILLTMKVLYRKKHP